MAFPTTGVLDDFNRANEDPLSQSSAWASTDPGGGSGTCEVTSNQAANLDGTGTFRSYRAADFGPDCEIFCTIATKPGTGDSVELLARLQQVGSSATWDGYRFVFGTASGNDTWNIDKIVNGAATTLATGTATELTAGDKIGAEVIGDRLRFLHFTGGSWVERVAVTDASISGVGKIGLGIRNTTARVDDFGGGTIHAGAGIAGLTGSGGSASEYTKAGAGVVGTVGSGSKEFTGQLTYVKVGYGTVGANGFGVYTNTPAGATSTKAGHGVVGTVASGGGLLRVQPRGVSIGFGDSVLEAYPTWTRIDA